MHFNQHGYELRCEWGKPGVAALAPMVDAIVIVDTLSFSTCVDVAVSRGAIVYPYPWKDDSAEAFARSVEAVLAGPRNKDRLSLSPMSLRQLPPGQRIVLPSPNGATLSGLTGGTPTLTGCLRNAATVAHVARSFGPRIGVVPAGEQWPDGSLRPAIEDWIGAGAVLSYLSGSTSPEADLARQAFLGTSGKLAEILQTSTSGRELIERGWMDDVSIASELNTSACAPILTEGSYRMAPGRS